MGVRWWFYNNEGGGGGNGKRSWEEGGRERRRRWAEEGVVDAAGGRDLVGACAAARGGELERGTEAERPGEVRQELPPPVGEPSPSRPQEGLLHPRGGVAHPPPPFPARQQVGAHGRPGM